MLHRGPDGTVDGWVTTREPEYTRHEVDLLLASRAVDADTYNGDITFTEAMDAANQFAFESTGATMNWAEKVRLDEQDAFKKKHKNANLNGVSFGVKRRQ